MPDIFDNRHMASQQLYSSPSAGFESPFEMLAACHGRVRQTLGLLLRLQAHVSARGADEQARQAAADVVRYFDVAAPAHHQDEETHVVPRLRAAGRDDLADQLLADHGALREAWQAMRARLQPLTEGQAALLDRDACRQFARLYERHAALEDEVIFPLASYGLAAEQLLGMGDEMATRRGASRAPPSLRGKG